MADAPIHADNPQPGYYRYRRNRDAAWEPCALFYPAGGVDPMICIIGPKTARRQEDPMRVWTYVADQKISKADYFAVYNTGKWKSDPPPAPVVKVEPPKRGIGDNSGAYGMQMVVEDLARMSEAMAADPTTQKVLAALKADVAAARAYYQDNKVIDKNSADQVENWRERIAKAGKALDERRKADKEPFAAIAKLVDERYFPVVREAEGCAVYLRALGDQWVRAETERRRLEAEIAAWAHQIKLDADNKALVDQGWPADVVAGLELRPPEPPPPAPEKVLIGTGSKRRSARKEKDTAAIVDLAAAAAYFASQDHPDLREVVQKLADKLAANGVAVPGCTIRKG